MTLSLLLHPLRGVTIVAALCGIALTPAAAQSTTDSKAASGTAPRNAPSSLTDQAAPKVSPHAPPNLNARLDFDFPQKKGGLEMTPLKVVLDTLVAEYRAAGNPVNVIYQDNASGNPGGKPAPEVMVAPMSLRQVTFMTAISALLAATTAPLNYKGSDEMVIIQTFARQNEQPQPPPPPTKQFSVWNIEEFLVREGKAKEKRKERLEILQKAMTKALSLAEVETPKLELDDESGLLFVSGTPEASNVVGEVINAAVVEPPRPAPSAPPAPDAAPPAKP